jgi:predicted acylesterase/phospholipase RssA
MTTIDRQRTQLQIGQQYQYQGEKGWNWSVWLEASDEELDKVDSVVYTLHPKFPDPVRTVEDRKTNFRLRSRSWGTFRIHAEVLLKDGSRVRMKHELVLKDAEGMPAAAFAEAPPEPLELLRIATELKGLRAFDKARRILSLARQQGIPDSRLRIKLAQQHALCTYKDPDLPAGERLREALDILGGVEDLQTTRNQETLGLLGAIYKRRWELDGQKAHLERSLAYYGRGYKEGLPGDYGYTAINTAYVLDLLASLELADAKKSNTISGTAEARVKEARQIREDMVVSLPRLAEQPDNAGLNDQWWFLVTMAEALFGLERYEEALSWLQRAAALPDIASWEYEATTRQLASLARLHAERDGSIEVPEETRAWKALSQFLGRNEAGVRTAYAGKVGLALSGGGFRASLFHIGVFARLAELDMLRHVEVLSCVSGGSVIGAHYYLEVRKLLQEKPDAEITREDYITIVERLQKDFLAGVQRNIRTRVAASLWANLRMIFDHNYSRTERAGDLFEREIFSRVPDGEGNGPRWLNDLFIKPKGEPENFAPKYDNWRRRTKVPILVLNATTLNTGHVWQFTASWMGEPPGDINTAIDGNERLRRMYYTEAPPAHQGIRLGHAVAASACVPGLFEPLVLAKLYPDRTVRLVDGGVHDNQGTASLLEESCTVQLVSDASGQMNTQPDPSRGLVGVPLRANSILMARVREAQYCELQVRESASLLRGLMFIHSKKDLDVEPVDWINCEDPEDPSDAAHPGQLTSYGILKEIQKRLAAIRTDLDSFSEVEAFALMTSAYRMTELEFASSIRGFPTSEATPRQWSFLAVERPMKQKTGCEAEHDALARLLEVGSSCAFKIWHLSRFLQALAVVCGLAALVGLTWWSIANWSRHLLSVKLVATPIFAALAGLIVGKTVMRVVRYRETLERIALGVGLALFGWLIAGLHLLIFDKWFLNCGRVVRLSSRSAAKMDANTRTQPTPQ